MTTLNSNNINIEPLTKLNFFNDFKTNSEVKDLVPGKKGVNIIFIVIENIKVLKLKNNQKIYTFLISDKTGSIFCNFYDEIGQCINVGDVIYVSKAYATLHKTECVLYSPKLEHGTILKIDEFCYDFIEKPNFSEVKWVKKGEIFEIMDESNSNNGNIGLLNTGNGSCIGGMSANSAPFDSRFNLIGNGNISNMINHLGGSKVMHNNSPQIGSNFTNNQMNKNTNNTANNINNVSMISNKSNSSNNDSFLKLFDKNNN